MLHFRQPYKILRLAISKETFAKGYLLIILKWNEAPIWCITYGLGEVGVQGLGKGSG